MRMTKTKPDIQATVVDPKVDFLKIVHLNPGSSIKNCVGCGADVAYDPKSSTYPIREVACNFSHADFSGLSPDYVEQPRQELSVESDINDIEEEVDNKPQSCPSCNGPRRGRGYTHVEGCSLSTAVKLAEKKPASTEPKETCQKCGGVRWGRGYNHQKGCTESTAFKLQLPERPPVETCPKCGGPKRGRGFSHNAPCSAT